ncbi:TPA: glycosyltransferase [Photobacterium damselae]
MLSIVVITFNDFDGLKKTLSSIYSYKEDSYISCIDVIIVDGSMLDEVKDLVKKFSSKLNIILISEKDNGIYDAMNKGLKYANQNHIIYMNSGDYFFDNAIKSFLSEHRDKNYLYYGDADFYEKEKLAFHFRSRMRMKSDFLKHNCFSHQAIYYPTKILKNINGYSLQYKISADFDLTWRCFIHGVHFQYLDEIVANCELGGVSCQNGIISYKDRIKSFKNSKAYTYMIILILKYPLFFLKNRTVRYFEGSAILSYYRRLRS